MGNFEFGAIKAETDYSIEEFGNTERAEFSFEGYDEYDPVSGRGWVIIENDTLKGKIFFHAGDDSEFKAKKIKWNSYNNVTGADGVKIAVVRKCRASSGFHLGRCSLANVRLP